MENKRLYCGLRNKNGNMIDEAIDPELRKELNQWLTKMAKESIDTQEPNDTNNSKNVST